MSADTSQVEAVDGRSARRQRNIDAVLDVVLDLFAEEAMFPTIEQVAARSGLSPRSVYRYFADPAELLESAIKRGRENARDLVHLHAIGQGPFEHRLSEFVEMRLRLYEAIAPRFRATVANATRNTRIRDELARNRNDLRTQFEAQFAPELASKRSADRQAVASAGDLLAQLDSIDYLRRHRQLSVAEAKATVAAGLRALLT